jgi:glycosyltransferase involved in cell wall biosynthesis
MDKSFDIIVTVYNTAPKYLSRCLDSIVSLEYDNFSLTIVDDCSTNIETISFLKGVKERYSDKGIEIEIIYSKSNGGVGQARNIGLKNSKKDLVWFIDSDDRISKPDALVIINQYWQKFPNIDILSFAITSYDDTDFDKPVLKHRKHTTCFPTPTSIENYVDGCKDKPGV